MRLAPLAFILACSAARAQVPAVPTNVVSVQTAGWWQNGSTSGTYRVLVINEGWERVWSRVFVEWLAESRNPDALQEVVQVKELSPPVEQSTVVLSTAVRRTRIGELVITLVATSNLDTKAKPNRFVYCAREPGAVQPCSGK